MNRILIFCALGALWGCRQAAELSGEAITLSCSTSEGSKTDALTAGDAVAVFARLDGTQTYFLEAEKFITGSDGKTLAVTPAVYYPETKQAVEFFAYFPYHTGTFSVPSDQSTAAALKQADLCWANASSTPVSAPVALEFTHKMARLLITTNESTTKMVFPNAFSGGTLDIKTGTFTNTQKSEVFTTGNELILPAQPLTRLLLTVAGVEHPFTPALPLNLPAGQTTTLNLTLNPITKTATLNGSSTTAWTTSATQGNPTAEASNAFSFYWVPAHWRATQVNKVVLTIKQGSTTTDYTIPSGVTHDNETFRFAFAANGLGYPYTIERIGLYNGQELIQSTERHLGATVYRTGPHTLGINARPINPPGPSDYVKIGSLYWAKGNLVALSKDNHRECKVGAPTDGGLYFQFGSIIGYKGGAQINGGTGVGIPTPVIPEGTQAEVPMVWPEELGRIPPHHMADKENVATLDNYYFNYSIAPWETMKQNIRNFAVSISGDKGTGTLFTGRYSHKGIGDPCNYYLGGKWRLPSTEEYLSICNNKIGGSFEECNASWTSSPVNGCYFAGNQIFFPAVGTAALWMVTKSAYYWSSSIGGATKGLMFGFNHAGSVTGQTNYYVRSHIFSVRCVSE